MRKFISFALLSLLLSSCQQQEAPMLQLENHHLHSFQSTRETALHAVAMGYQFICHEKPEGNEFEYLDLITTHNARVGPVRIFVDKKTREIMVEYHDRYLLPESNKSAIAFQFGMEREADKLYPLTEDDWFIISSYSATRKDVADLDVKDVSESTFEEYFKKTWPLENEKYRSFNLGANWQSRKVVEDFLKYLKVQEDWEKYGALFLDGINNIDVENPVNKGFGGLGHYNSAREGQHDFMSRICDYLRNPDSTGRNSPVMIFGNIWSPKSEGGYKILEAYGKNKFRFDHYYYESGGVGEQQPNGVVPGTEEPAYVVPDQPESYIPASRVALDDVYAFNKKMDVYNRKEHFLQHLDACGTAGLSGAWFGWYGEDYLTRRDQDGKLMYTNDLQLLRAIPNWDNLWGIPVPSLEGDEEIRDRRWNENVYISSKSYASENLVYSISPFNNEVYIVFLDKDARVDLKGEAVLAAWWVDDWFMKTDESAMNALVIEKGMVSLNPEYAEDGLKRGIRIVVDVP